MTVRQHYWDTLRAFLMLLGIPYHVAMAYRPGQVWIVRSDEGIAAFTWLADIIHYFRMPAFFVIAGYFSALLLTRRAPVSWLKGRFIRLGVPFVATVLTLVPVMNLACEFSNLSYSDALSSFVWNSSHSGGYWVRHLWFIVVLLYLSSAAALLFRSRPRLREACVPSRFDEAIARHFVIALALVALVVGLWEAAAIELFYMAGLATNVPQQIFRLDELLTYTPYYLIGFAVQRAPRTLEKMCRPSLPVALLAVLFIGLSLTVAGSMHPAPGRLVTSIAAVASTQVLIAVACTLLDRPVTIVRKFTEASYVLYLFHMPIICVLVWLAQDLTVPVALKGLAIMLLSLGLSYAGWLLVERSRLLSFLFNGMTVTSPLKRAEPALEARQFSVPQRPRTPEAPQTASPTVEHLQGDSLKP